MIMKKSIRNITIKDKVYRTMNITGKIIKVVIDPEQIEKDCKVQIYTSEKELIADWEGNKYAVLYPRNYYISREKYEKPSAIGDVYEKWVNSGQLTIIIDNNGIEGFIKKIEVIYEE